MVGKSTTSNNNNLIATGVALFSVIHAVTVTILVFLLDATAIVINCTGIPLSL